MILMFPPKRRRSSKVKKLGSACTKKATLSTMLSGTVGRVVTSILVVLEPLRWAQEVGARSNSENATRNVRERREVEVMIVFSVDVTRKVIEEAASMDADPGHGNGPHRRDACSSVWSPCL